MIRRPPRSTPQDSSAASDVYKRQVMGVPAHDQRDFEFAKKNNIDINQVIIKDKNEQTNELDEAYVENGFLINSNQYNGIANTIAKLKISEEGVNNGWAENKIQYRLRDWLISRQSCLLYTSPSPRDKTVSRMPSSA